MIGNSQLETDHQRTHPAIKRQRIPEGQPKMDNTEKLATQGTHDDEK